MTSSPPTDASEIVGLARAHGLNVDASTVRLDDSGADFRVAHGADEEGVAWIIRVPRREDAAVRTVAERRALELIRGRLPAEVPDWRIFSERLIAYPRLSGDPAADIDLEQGGYVWRFDLAPPPDAFIGTLAAVLVALHSVPEAAASLAGLPVRHPEQARSALPRRMARCRDHLSVPQAVWDRWNRWVDDDDFWPDTAVLVHGDLHPPHVLVDAGIGVVGILDWSEAHVGDAATDFALLYASMGAAACASLLRAYEARGGRVAGRMLEHIAETWAAYPTTLMEFALQSGESGPLQLAQALIDATAAEMGAA